MRTERPQQPVIAILGPTASGKSSLAEALAQSLDGEIISADSMQIYKGMNIGTAKVPLEKRCVAYHCIDFIDPGQPYSAALFQKDSRSAIQDIQNRGKMPIICGGTFFYVRACLDEMDFAAGEQKENPVRQRYQKFLEENGTQALYELLKSADPRSAAVIHPNNTVRVIRALEMHDRGESYAQRKEALSTIQQAIPSLKIGLDVQRDVLYERINERVDCMFADGLLEEVERLCAHGFRDACTAKSAIGYKEVVAYLDGEISLKEASEQIKQATRRYSKRQRSWLRGMPEIQWIDATDADLERICTEAYALIEKFRT